MKTIAITIVWILAFAEHCFAVGDPVSSIAKGENRETTTFQRDGKTILKVTLYRPTEPEQRRVLIQQVIFNDEEVMAITDFEGTRAFSVGPNAHISVLTETTSTGRLEKVELMDDAHRLVELSDVKNSKLIPISGKRLERARALLKDMSELFAPESVKKTTPQGFVERALDLVKKHSTEESDNQATNNSGDKPTPQNPADKENH